AMAEAYGDAAGGAATAGGGLAVAEAVARGEAAGPTELVVTETVLRAREDARRQATRKGKADQQDGRHTQPA
ncbi:hypothetical protein, partial [Streptomyces buecherae]|uniref:hypothetical protein n=1 Tax=Streptomyces buecherae TaxID=2763006 RepID=UPI001C9B9EA8